MFYPSDETDETKTYQNQNIFEVVLPTTTKTITNSKFKDNKIRKVNLEELTNLESIGARAFNNNFLTGLLDLSKLTKLKKIETQSFFNGIQTGSLILSPSIESIGEYAFTTGASTSSDDELYRGGSSLKGELKIPSSLKLIENSAFSNNNLTKIDWSDAENLTEIGTAAFKGNQISSLDFINFPPKLEKIGIQAFSFNVEKLITSNISLTPALKIIEYQAFDVVDNITIRVSANATNISKNSFNGKGITVLKNIT